MTLENTAKRFCVILLLSAFLQMPDISLFADEASAGAYLETARSNMPMLIAFIREMPKGADLHNHVSGAIYAESIIDYAASTDLFFDTQAGCFTRTAGAASIPASGMKTNSAAMRKFLDAASMRGAGEALKSGHDHFFDYFTSFSNITSAMDPDRMIAEVVSRAKAQNIQYMELMTGVAPKAAVDAATASPPSIENMDSALAAMQERFPGLLSASKQYLDQRDSNVADLTKVPSPITGSSAPINIRYIYSLSRNIPLPQFFASMACGMAIVRNDSRVAAINIVTAEDDTNSRINFSKQMEIINFLWQRMGKPNLTLHAGELTLEYSPVEVMRSRIRQSIDSGHARRIGHGVSIAWEDDMHGLLRQMKMDGIAVEICLTSNEGILNISGDQHPLPLYLKADVPVTLNTDDEGVNRSNLTMEYVKAAGVHHLSYADLKKIARNSLEYSFLTGMSLYEERNYAKLIPAFAGIRNADWHPSAEAVRLMKNSDKLKKQVQLERAFAAFEQKY